jgi:diguanylate cyclase (GGDEF)-like protein
VTADRRYFRHTVRLQAVFLMQLNRLQAEVKLLNIVSPINSRLGFEVDSWTLEFRDRSIEDDFRRHHLPETHRSLAVTLTVCSLFYLAFAITDVAVLGYSTTTAWLFLGRLCFALSAVAGMGFVKLRKESTRVTSIVASLVELVGIAVFMPIVWERTDQLAWHAMSMCIMLIVVYIFIPNTLLLASSVATVSTGLFIASAVALNTMKPADLLTMSMLLLFTNSVGYLAARRFSRLAREEFWQHSLLTNLSIRDHLTGCFNRRYLSDFLFDSELRRGRRHKETLSIILCDIDHFKQINDSYGHASGDAVLRTFANILLSQAREGVDSVVRYGGEEFMILLPQTGERSAAAVAERLRQSLASTRAFVSGGREIRATASFGVVAVDLTRDDLAITEEAIIAAADAQLYRAKNEGRNRICVDHASLVGMPSPRGSVAANR